MTYLVHLASQAFKFYFLKILLFMNLNYEITTNSSCLNTAVIFWRTVEWFWANENPGHDNFFSYWMHDWCITCSDVEEYKFFVTVPLGLQKLGDLNVISFFSRLHCIFYFIYFFPGIVSVDFFFLFFYSA